MLKIHTLTLGDYQTNCYLVHESGSHRCVVIDPGYEPEVIMEQAARLGLTMEAVLLTHGHFDHVGGVQKILAATRCKLWIHGTDLKQPMLYRRLYPLTLADCPDALLYEDGQSVSAAGLTFQVLETPGHTRGSVCLMAGDALFCGDTLFAGSCGRTDLPGGSWGEMRRSLSRLAALPGDYRVFSGHGRPTTLERERKFNIHLKG